MAHERVGVGVGVGVGERSGPRGRGRELEVADGGSAASPAGDRLTGDAPYRWLAARLRAELPGCEYAYFWSWDPRAQVLTPHALIFDAAPARTPERWPGGLRLGQGFAGRCAEKLQDVIEDRIERGRGATTGIETPYPFLREGVPLGSIHNHVVKDAYRLHGVLSIASEAPGHFEGSPNGALHEIIAMLRDHLRSVDLRVIEGLRSGLETDLLGSLARPDTPTRFWRRIEKLLRQLELRGLCSAAALYVRKQRQPTHYTCKAASPRVGELRAHPIRSEDDDLFRRLLAIPEGVHELEQPLRRPPLDLLLAPGRYWVKRYPATVARGDTPVLLALAMLEPASPHGVFGERAMEHTLDQVFANVFATTRAILTAADNSRIGREKMRVFSAVTHDIRGPVAALRGFAEALEQLNEDDELRRRHILRLADDAILRIENTLYEWNDPQKAPELVAIEPREFVRDIVQQVGANIAEKVVFIEDSSLAGYTLYGHPLSLNLALKNVLDNAVKFGGGAPVHVRARASLAEASSARPYRLTITVRDYGIGIPAESRRAIFEHGHRTEHSRKHIVKGAGVGLSITKAIIENHDGMIWVDPAVPVGDGTSMAIVLPLHRRA